MFKFIVICALLTTVCAVRRGFGHSRVAYSHADSKPVYASVDDGGGDRLHDAIYYHLEKSHGGGSKASDANAEVVSAGSHIRPDGFDYHLETTNGVSNKASGDDSGRIHGNFQWISPEGEHVSLSYVADENGYHPDSALLPTPPPIPEAILKSLEYNEKHPYKEDDDAHYDHDEEYDHQQYDHHPQSQQYDHHPQPQQNDHHQQPHQYHVHPHPHHQHQFHYNNRRF